MWLLINVYQHNDDWASVRRVADQMIKEFPGDAYVGILRKSYNNFARNEAAVEAKAKARRYAIGEIIGAAAIVLVSSAVLGWLIRKRRKAKKAAMAKEGREG